MGLIHGHWDIKESDMNKPDYPHDSTRGVNMGIAVVVPAKKILEVFAHPELQELIQRYEAALQKRNSPIAD